MCDSRYFIAKGKHLVVPVTKQEYEDYWNKKRKEPMTNEEWLNGLSTIEKAKVIVNLGREQRFPKDVEVEICEQWLRKEHRESE